ncbi:MAG: radical SAM family heme chaperone HemW [Nitrospirae bacterium]|nr:radical SAM family heme chaperone HemW [Nitrospirota bacterium]
MVHYLYIHVPFCVAKCDYCDFYSIPVARTGSDEIKEYAVALLDEMALRREVAGDLRTVYLGGGTPTLFSAEEVSALLSGAREIFSIVQGAEITIEANPGTITDRQLAGLREAGINRISIGMQSLSGRELCTLGRSHNAEDALSAVKSARQAGFDNISLDLIYGIPGQNMEVWQDTMLRALELLPEHISAYELTPEENTRLHTRLANGFYELPEEQLVIGMYYEAVRMMQSHGYRHYEISNFAKPGCESIHNLNYWDRGEYLGIGAAAHSFVNGMRTGNKRDIARYMESVKNEVMPVDEEIYVTEQDAFREMIFLGLRKTEGIDLDTIAESGMSLKKSAVDELAGHGLIEIKDNRLRLTTKGLVMSSEVMVRLM